MKQNFKIGDIVIYNFKKRHHRPEPSEKELKGQMLKIIGSVNLKFGDTILYFDKTSFPGFYAKSFRKATPIEVLQYRMQNEVGTLNDYRVTQIDIFSGSKRKGKLTASAPHECNRKPGKGKL